MTAFEKFLLDAASRREPVNTLFEERLFGLIEILHKITEALASAQIPHEVIGGLAVLIHVEEANPELSTLTRDVDLMVYRSDLERIKLAAEAHGFRHVAGVDMLVYGGTEPVKNSVRLIFNGVAACSIDPERKQFHGKEIPIIPVADLVRMKLTSYRDKDRVHVRGMDAAGLITQDVERGLTPELLARLKHIRETE